MNRGWSIGVAAAGALLAGTAMAWGPLPAASGCDSIASVPLRQHMNYNDDIQSIFDARCANCHVQPEGQPAADLLLDAPDSWFFLVGEPSSQNSAFIRVVPGNPFNSLLFLKVNCETPGVGVRMPRNRPAISAQEQAMIHDWILAGAPIDSDDTVFRAEFESRG
ncbi:MAG: hypothetical protein ABI411_12690 [Tahibacter sp.]